MRRRQQYLFMSHFYSNMRIEIYEQLSLECAEYANNKTTDFRSRDLDTFLDSFSSKILLFSENEIVFL